MCCPRPEVSSCMRDIVVQQGKIPFKDENMQTPMVKSTRLFHRVNGFYSESTGGLVFPFANLLTCVIYKNPTLKFQSVVRYLMFVSWLNFVFSLAPTIYV